MFHFLYFKFGNNYYFLIINNLFLSPMYFKGIVIMFHFIYFKFGNDYYFRFLSNLFLSPMY